MDGNGGTGGSRPREAVLTELAPDRLWTSVMPYGAMGLDLGARMVLIRLHDGGLLAHSPIGLTPGIRRQVESLGPVRVLVAPNRMHYLHTAEWTGAFPDAALYAATGLERLKENPCFRAYLGQEPEPAWEGELDQALFRGVPLLNEIVFFHPETRTLILTDVCFHLGPDRTPWTRLYAGLSRGLGRVAPTAVFRTILRDRRAAKESVDRILEWDFDRITVAHGDVLETGGREQFRSAWAWL